MRISGKKIVQNTPFFAQSHLWSIHFVNDQRWNLLDMGGSVGKGLPATSIVEPLFDLEWEALPVRGGHTLNLPKAANHHTTLQVSLHDSENYDISSLMVEWVNAVIKEGQTSFKNLEKQAKQVAIRKYNRREGTAIYSNTYLVLPGEELLYSGGNDLEWIKNDFNLRVVKATKKQGIK